MTNWTISILWIEISCKVPLNCIFLEQKFENENIYRVYNMDWGTFERAIMTDYGVRQFTLSIL